jgi:multiple sugar transport system permease protein
MSRAGREGCMERRTSASIISTAIAAVCAAVWLLPVIWMVVVAVKPKGSNVVDLSTWVVPPFTLDNVRYVLHNAQSSIGVWLWNSLLVSGLTTAGGIALAALAAFAFSRMRFVLKGFWFWFIMMSLMIPSEATLIPIYVQFRNLGLLNTYASLILPGLAGPVGVVLLKQFFDGLPPSLFEAARMDGCGWGQILLKIYLALSKPALASLGIFTFLGVWNAFIWPYISITDPRFMTVPIGIVFFHSQYNNDMAYPMAANALAAIPVLAVFVAMQKYIIKGITFTGIKG